MMKRWMPILLVALIAARASSQVITILRDYRFEDKPVLPPDYLVRGDDGTLYGMNNYALYRWQPDGSGFTILKQFPIDATSSEYFIGRPALSGNTLYGALRSFKVFKINTDGTSYTVLKDDILGGNPFVRTRVVLAVEPPGVVLSGDTLYGWGFKINTDGTGYTELAGFPTWDGLQDWHLDIQVSGDKIYGATARDGKHGAGTLFRLNTDGTGCTVLVDIPAKDQSNIEDYLTLVGDTLYVASYPGLSHGRVFKVKTDGTGYSVLKEFGGESGLLSTGPLVHSGGKLYGSTFVTDTFLGPTNWTVFSMKTNGTGYTPLKHFIESSQPLQGPSRVEVLTVSGDTIYGLAESIRGFEGGEDGLDGRGGALFRMNIDGTGFEVLHEFMVPNLFPDGSFPGPLTVSEGVLYGVDFGGNGKNGRRRVFKINYDGTGYTVLKAYDPIDSFDPDVQLTASGSTLFGIQRGRGVLQIDPYDESLARVYRMNTDGTGYAMLKEFTWLADGLGAQPTAALAVSSNTLYGAIPGDGFTTEGRLFKLNTDSTGYAVLHTFGLVGFDPSQGSFTNSDGAHLTGDLTVSGNTVYGTASQGGILGAGTTFKLNTDGTGFMVLKHFGYPVLDTNSMSYTNTDGAVPLPGMVLEDNTLYGTTSSGGHFGSGTVFKGNTDGTGFTALKQFSQYALDTPSGYYTNSDGASPLPGLKLWGNTLYGTTSTGGHFGSGTVFKVNTDGTGFTVIAHIGGSNQPWTGRYLERLALSGSSLYGSAESGGDKRVGAIFRIDLAPTLSIGRTLSGDVAVSWPSDWTDYVLQQRLDSLSALNWSNVTETIQDDGTNKSITVSPKLGANYYRLFKP